MMVPEGKGGQQSKEKKNQGGEKKKTELWPQTTMMGEEGAGELRNTENGKGGKVGKVSECRTWCKLIQKPAVGPADGWAAQQEMIGHCTKKTKQSDCKKSYKMGLKYNLLPHDD